MGAVQGEAMFKPQVTLLAEVSGICKTGIKPLWIGDLLPDLINKARGIDRTHRIFGQNGMVYQQITAVFCFQLIQAVDRQP